MIVSVPRALITGHYDDAERLAAEYLALSRQTQDLTAQGIHDAFICQVHEDRGTLERWSPQPLSVEMARFLPVYLASAGRTHHVRGDVDLARTFFDELCPLLPDLPRNTTWPVARHIDPKLIRILPTDPPPPPPPGEPSPATLTASAAFAPASTSPPPPAAPSVPPSSRPIGSVVGP